MLSRRCQGRAGRCSDTGQPHVECSGQVAREAAIYPAKLCKAILEGFSRQLQSDGMMEAGVTGIDVAKQCQIEENKAKLRENDAKIAQLVGQIAGHDPTYVAALDSTLMRCIPKRQVEFESLDTKVHMEAGSRELLGTKAGRREESPTRGSAQAIPEGLPTRGRRQVEVGRGSNQATAYSRRRLPMTRDTSSTATKTASSGSLGSATTFRQSVLSCTTC